MKCRHCGAPRASRLFTVRLCREKRKERRIWLCEGCDWLLQEKILIFIKHHEVRSGLDV